MYSSYYSSFSLKNNQHTLFIFGERKKYCAYFMTPEHIFCFRFTINIYYTIDLIVLNPLLGGVPFFNN